MSGDDLVQVRCRCGCGLLFWAERPTRGPLRGYYSGACRQAAYRARVQQELATEVADLALSLSHERLSAALSRLGGSTLKNVRAYLGGAAALNPSRFDDDRLCTEATTGPCGVVASLHKER